MTNLWSTAARTALTTLATLTALAAIALPACSKKEGAPGAPGTQAGPARVTLALDWVPEPEFGGFYAARESGSFKKNGLDVEIRGGGAGVPVVQMVATGQVQFGIAGGDEVLTARARGADVIPVFATFQTSPQAIMTPASRSTTTLKDVLANGTLALEPGLPYAAYLKKKYGFGAKVVPYDGGVARFLVEKDYAQQCFVTSEPLLAKKKGVEPRVFLVADEGFNPYTAVVITSRAVLRDHPDWVKGFVAASREGWTGYLADPGPANAVMGKLNTTMDAETFAAAAAAQKPLTESEATKAGGIGAMTKERWETLGKQLVELKIIEKAPAVADFWMN